MRQIIVILIFSISVSCRQEPVDFDIGQIKFRGLSIYSNLSEITKAFGNPQTGKFICGFSEEDPSDTLNQLIYKNFNFVGGYENNYVLYSIEFDSKGEIEISYGDISLNGLTRKSDFAGIFEKKLRTTLFY
jgi:hypothetical protein